MLMLKLPLWTWMQGYRGRGGRIRSVHLPTMESTNQRRLEEEHVRQVYDDIAHHFSNTRYKAWPIVESFMQNLAAFSLGLDVGCGNGKNMIIRQHDLLCTGFDLSWELLAICQGKHNLPVVYGNMLSLPFRPSSHDFIICIASLHHLASAERRLAAVREMGRILRPGGLVLLFVWALEQPPSSSLYRHQLKYLSPNNVQDVLVPWTTTAKTEGDAAQGKSEGPDVNYRFYHLFRKDELEELLHHSGMFKIEYSGYDRDNWYCCASRL